MRVSLAVLGIWLWWKIEYWSSAKRCSRRLHLKKQMINISLSFIFSMRGIIRDVCCYLTALASYFLNRQQIIKWDTCRLLRVMKTRFGKIILPGPLAPPCNSRPSLNITARSYSWTIFIQRQRENGNVAPITRIENTVRIFVQYPVLFEAETDKKAKRVHSKLSRISTKENGFNLKINKNYISAFRWTNDQNHNDIFAGIFSAP